MNSLRRVPAPLLFALAIGGHDFLEALLDAKPVEPDPRDAEQDLEAWAAADGRGRWLAIVMAARWGARWLF